MTFGNKLILEQEKVELQLPEKEIEKEKGSLIALAQQRKANIQIHINPGQFVYEIRKKWSDARPAFLVDFLSHAGH